ncbi:MAG: hypothetical protein KF836_07820 [Fimbriimonadaceae bacterium]|nr:hypothetical protein [Fimbriimonadaceae bacterium]
MKRTQTNLKTASNGASDGLQTNTKAGNTTYMTASGSEVWSTILSRKVSQSEADAFLLALTGYMKSLIQAQNGRTNNGTTA